MSISRYIVVAHVVFRAGEFDALPDRIRHLERWQGHSGGEIRHLKAHYRLQIAEQGFVVAYQHLANFSAQINRQPAE